MAALRFLFSLVLVVILGAFAGSASAAPSGITCPSGTKPTGGWPMVFTFNGNCFKAVGTGSLAGDVNTALLNAKAACVATIAYGNIVHASDIDAMIRTKVVPLIQKNTAYINPQKIGSAGFSAGGALAAYLGAEWAVGIDPGTSTNYNFKVTAVLNFYGPLRMDRAPSLDGSGVDIGGGGLFYLHENRKQDINVDIPNIRQWSSPNCYCSGRGTNQCMCDVASTTYMNAYLTAYSSNPTCTFYSDEANLEAMGVTNWIQTKKPAHVAPEYMCAGWKDSNVDYDMNVHQLQSWWPSSSRVLVRAEDGHGFPLSVCQSTAATLGIVDPIVWMTSQLNVTANSPPIYR
jgi:hypothetical protein